MRHALRALRITLIIAGTVAVGLTLLAYAIAGFGGIG